MPDRLSWAEIRRLALQHRKALIWANVVAVLATLCSVPIPLLLLPLLVDEVLLNDGDMPRSASWITSCRPSGKRPPAISV